MITTELKEISYKGFSIVPSHIPTYTYVFDHNNVKISYVNTMLEAFQLVDYLANSTIITEEVDEDEKF